MTVCTTNLQQKRDKNKTKYQAKIHRHESGKGKKTEIIFQGVFNFFKFQTSKVFKTALF